MSTEDESRSLETKIREVSDRTIILVALLVFMGGALAIHYAKGGEIEGALSASYGITGWRITHFLLYLVMGYFFPTKVILFMSLGVLWEFLEYSLRCSLSDPYWGEGWDYIQDVITNFFGFITGILLFCQLKRSPKPRSSDKSSRESDDVP
jgi:hypothetical protein